MCNINDSGGFVLSSWRVQSHLEEILDKLLSKDLEIFFHSEESTLSLFEVQTLYTFGHELEWCNFPNYYLINYNTDRELSYCY